MVRTLRKYPHFVTLHENSATFCWQTMSWGVWSCDRLEKKITERVFL